MKQSADIALGLKGDSHKHDCVNFFRPKANTTSSGFTSLNVDASNSNGIVRDETFVLTFQGLKVQECVCGDGVYVELKGAHHRQIFIVVHSKRFNEALRCPNHCKKNNFWHT
jgi:hypothetical protein